jgi:hypothetical protein
VTTVAWPESGCTARYGDKKSADLSAREKDQRRKRSHPPAPWPLGLRMARGLDVSGVPNGAPSVHFDTSGFRSLKDGAHIR